MALFGKTKNDGEEVIEEVKDEKKGRFGLPFGKKSNGDEDGAAEAEESSEDTSKKKRGRKQKKKDKKKEQQAKPSESLGTVLAESVPSASLDIIRANGAFKYDAGAKSGHQCYVVATLDVADIGGLNKRMKADPDKGQFIECITNGTVESHVSEAGIEAGKFIIIPSETTLRSLSEFSFLSDEERFKDFIPTLVQVDASGHMDMEEIPGARVGYRWYLDVLKGNIDINEAVRAATEAGAANLEEQARADEEEEEEVVAQKEEKPSGVVSHGSLADAVKSSEAEKQEPELNIFGQPIEQPVDEEEAEEEEPEIVMADTDGPVMAQSPDAEMDDSAMVMPDADMPPMMDAQNPVGLEAQIECPVCNHIIPTGVPCPFCGWMEGSLTADAAGDDTIEEITDAEIQDAVERLFHAGDLDLQITSQPFDMQFMQKNEFEPISEDRGDGWLDGYVTQMVKNANSELRKVHRQNLFKTRDQYIQLITQQCERIAHEVDVDDTTNPYYLARKAIRETTTEKKNAMEIEVDKRRTQMQQSWDEELENICESAKAAAKRNYLEKNSTAHEAALRNVEIALADEIEIDYNKQLTELNERRKTEAKRQLDIATTQALITMNEEYAKRLQEEEELRQKYLDEIQEYLDTHRKDEAARMIVVAEELKQKSEADKVTEKFEQDIKILTAEHDATCAKLHQEIQAAQQHEEAVMREMGKRHEEFTARETEMNGKMNELLDKFASLDAMKTKEYESRLITLESDKKAAEEHLQHVDLIHNKFNKVSIVVWVAIAVAAFMVGMLWGTSRGAKVATSGGGHYSISFSREGEEGEVTEENGDGTESMDETDTGTTDGE